MLQPSEPTYRPHTEFTNLLETPHDTLPELHTKMTGINELLPAVGLENVRPFADAYHTLTERANRVLENNAFIDPDTTVRLAGNFAGLYFDALSSHNEGKPEEIATSWQQVFYPI